MLAYLGSLGACADSNDDAVPNASTERGLATVRDALERAFESIESDDAAGVIDLTVEACRTDLGTEEEVAVELAKSSFGDGLYVEYPLDEVFVDVQNGDRILVRYGLEDFWQLGEAGTFLLVWEERQWRSAFCLDDGRPMLEDRASGIFGETLIGAENIAITVDEFQWDGDDDGILRFHLKVCTPDDVDGHAAIRPADFRPGQLSTEHFARLREPSSPLIVPSGECSEQQLSFDVRKREDFDGSYLSPQIDWSAWSVQYSGGLGYLGWGEAEDGHERKSE